MQEGDKLYIVTRRDLSPGAQAVQGMHALREFVQAHPELDSEWYRTSNYLGFLSVEDERELTTLLNRCSLFGVQTALFQEPDLGGSLTAIAIAPSGRKLVAKLPLALN